MSRTCKETCLLHWAARRALKLMVWEVMRLGKVSCNCDKSEEKSSLYWIMALAPSGHISFPTALAVLLEAVWSTVVDSCRIYCWNVFLSTNEVVSLKAQVQTSLKNILLPQMGTPWMFSISTHSLKSHTFFLQRGPGEENLKNLLLCGKRKGLISIFCNHRVFLQYQTYSCL